MVFMYLLLFIYFRKGGIKAPPYGLRYLPSGASPYNPHRPVHGTGRCDVYSVTGSSSGIFCVILQGGPLQRREVVLVTVSPQLSHVPL